jgi:NDP-sugar pyrophosphorylase family protein
VRTEPLGVGSARQELQARKTEYLPVTQDGILTDMFVLWAVNTPLDTVAVIMAGGLGTRLSPLTDNLPKPLVELAGKPILTHIIEHLREQGVSRFVLSLNYLGDMIVNQYGTGRDLGVEINYVRENKRLGTGGALSLIDPAQLSEPFLCMNGDILSDIDVNALLAQHQENGWHGTMVAKEFHYTVPYGVVRRSDSGEFRGSDEKPTLSFPINAGIYMLSTDVLGMIPKDEFFDLPTLFDKLSETPGRAGTSVHPGRWIDIGSMAELDRAQQLYESKL